MSGTESDEEVTHDMHAADPDEALAARNHFAAVAPNPSPHRGLSHFKTRAGKWRVRACHNYIDSNGKKHRVYGTSRSAGGFTNIGGKLL
jgi:hypothetical protein